MNINSEKLKKANEILEWEDIWSTETDGRVIQLRSSLDPHDSYHFKIVVNLNGDVSILVHESPDLHYDVYFRFFELDEMHPTKEAASGKLTPAVNITEPVISSHGRYNHATLHCSKCDRSITTSRGRNVSNNKLVSWLMSDARSAGWYTTKPYLCPYCLSVLVANASRKE